MTAERESELGGNDGGSVEGRRPTEVRSRGTVAQLFFLANPSSDTKLKSELILIQSL
jgi:hypothetical protein